MLKITDGIRSLLVSKKDANVMELRLNLSEYGKSWSNIGDILYNFFTCKKNIEIMEVKPEQFNELKSYITITEKNLVKCT